MPLTTLTHADLIARYGLTPGAKMPFAPAYRGATLYAGAVAAAHPEMGEVAINPPLNQSDIIAPWSLSLDRWVAQLGNLLSAKVARCGETRANAETREDLRKAITFVVACSPMLAADLALTEGALLEHMWPVLLPDFAAKHQKLLGAGAADKPLSALFRQKPVIAELLVGPEGVLANGAPALAVLQRANCNFVRPTNQESFDELVVAMSTAYPVGALDTVTLEALCSANVPKASTGAATFRELLAAAAAAPAELTHAHRLMHFEVSEPWDQLSQRITSLLAHRVPAKLVETYLLEPSTALDFKPGRFKDYSADQLLDTVLAGAPASQLTLEKWPVSVRPALEAAQLKEAMADAMAGQAPALTAPTRRGMAL